MAVGVWQRLDQTGRNLLPFAVTILLLLVGMVPTQLPGYAAVAPPLVVMSVYYWAIHRPDLLRPSVAFLIGVLHDLLSGTPLGMTPLVLVLAYWVTLTQRRMFLGDSFAWLWLGFAMVSVGTALVQWVVYSLMHAQLFDAGPVAVQAVLAIGVFPLPAWVLMRIHRTFLS
ncbi:MAG TPA: rod shape-determining protein MreD [Azospirillaceae bacterium]|nr:rod shape-determining protein MreD [Azospirillaceae bacterium]